MNRSMSTPPLPYRTIIRYCSMRGLSLILNTVVRLSPSLRFIEVLVAVIMGSSKAKTNQQTKITHGEYNKNTPAHTDIFDVVLLPVELCTIFKYVGVRIWADIESHGRILAILFIGSCSGAWPKRSTPRVCVRPPSSPPTLASLSMLLCGDSPWTCGQSV